MKQLVLAFLVLVPSTVAFAQTTIAPEDASRHVGKEVTVQGTADQVQAHHSGVIFINMGGRYPDHAFTGFVPAEHADAFADAEEMEGETIAITGTIELYRGKPEIVLTSPDQITRP